MKVKVIKKADEILIDLVIEAGDSLSKSDFEVVFPLSFRDSLDEQGDVIHTKEARAQGAVKRINKRYNEMMADIAYFNLPLNP